MPPPSRRAHLYLRRRGHQGGSILPHRSIWSLRLPMHRLVLGVAIASAFTALMLLAEPLLAAAWGEVVVGWARALALPGRFVPPDLGALGVVAFAVPQADLRLPEGGVLVLGLHAVLMVAMWVGAGWLPDAFRPAGFLLRFIAMVHGSAVLYFALWPGSFPHSPAGHVGAGLRQGWALMLLTPWLHLATYYLFPFRWWRRPLLTAVSLAWLALLTPMQFSLHLALLSVFGPVVMPLLHLVFGVMLPILGLVALYGWGMGWQAPGSRQGRRWFPADVQAQEQALVHAQEQAA